MARGDPNRKTCHDDVHAALAQAKGNVSEAARLLGVARATIRRHRKALIEKGVDVCEPPWHACRGQTMPPEFRELIADRYASTAIDPEYSAGRIEAREIQERDLPKPGKVATYFLTAATNNTKLHAALWRNLMALKAHYEADGPVEILVRRIGYNLAHWRRRGASNEVETNQDVDPIWFDPKLVPHICDDRVQLAPGIQWAGDAPVSATAVSPLSGYDTFTSEDDGIFGATKLEMRSVPTMQGQPAKQLFTTGAVTQRNYSETKAGQKADWHHVFGCTLVEVDSDGTYFTRPIVADDDGTIRDLNVTVKNGRVILGHNLVGLSPGDVHVAELHPDIMAAVYGPGGMTDQLQPRNLFHHDLHDHKARSHHDERDPMRRYQLHREGADSVEREIEADAEFLRYAARPFMTQVVVGSNHDDHLHRWLKSADWRADPVNMAFYLEAASRTIRAIRDGESDFHLLEWACREKGAPEDVVFLRTDQSWLVEGVECGLHGDKGPNGSRGSVRNLSRIGAKTTIGHSHSPGIVDGCWQAGVTAGDPDEPRMDYATGPSSWSRTHVAQYEGGKRTMITMRGTRWRADRCSTV